MRRSSEGRQAAFHVIEYCDTLLTERVEKQGTQSTELKRPRIDVVPRVSVFFRDAFLNLMDLIDKAARMVGALDEP